MSEKEFSELYEIYLPKIFAFVSRRVNSRSEAEDLVSSIFLRAAEHIADFNPKKSSFKTWIYTITTRMMIDYFRSHAKKKLEPIENAEEIPAAGNPHESAKKSQEQAAVFTAMQKMPERHQKVLMLKYYGDFSISELADALAVTENNASVMLHRAHAAFEVAYQHLC